MTRLARARHRQGPKTFITETASTGTGYVRAVEAIAAEVPPWVAGFDGAELNAVELTAGPEPVARPAVVQVSYPPFGTAEYAALLALSLGRYVR